MNFFEFLIPSAHAQAAGAPQGGGMGMLLFPIILIGVMYFLMIRPQMKRQKEHAAMLGKLALGDEVITNGGIAGIVRELGDHFVAVEIADGVRVHVPTICMVVYLLQCCFLVL